MVTYYISNTGNVYQGFPAPNDREATQDEINAWNSYVLKQQIAGMTVNSFQAIAAIQQAQGMGITNYDLYARVMDVINSSTDPMVALAWERTTQWNRQSPLLNQLGDACSLSEGQRDALFLLASTIQA